MKPTIRSIPCAFYTDVATHFRSKVVLFAGPEVYNRACRHRAEFGPGSALVLDFGQDPESLIFPVSDRIIKIDWPGVDWVRLKQLERALIRDGADVVAGCGCDGELILFPVQESQRKPKLKQVTASFVCHFEALGPGRAA